MADQPIIIKKVKKKGHGGHHGGAWKVAYADFVTAMMAFFMVMWIIGMSQESRSLIQAYFNDPFGFSQDPERYRVEIANNGALRPGPNDTTDAGRNIEGDVRVEKQVREALSADPALESMVDKGLIAVDVTSEGVLIEFIENDDQEGAFFALGQSEVRPAMRAPIAAVAEVLAQQDRSIIIEGHTDARPYSAAGFDNYDLSADRANAVRRVMRDAGFPKDQVAEVTGLADSRLRVPNEPLHPGNRRVSVLLKAEAVPGGLKPDLAERFFLPAPDVGPEPVDITRGSN